MLIIDSERAKINDRVIRQQISREQTAKWLAENKHDCEYKETDSLPIDEQLRHIGKPLSYQEFERRLKKINPGLQFIWVKGSLICPHRKIVRNGVEVDGTAFPALVMPERSIWRIQEEETPDDILDPTFRVPEAGAFGPSEWQPIRGYEHLWEPDGRGIGRWKQTDPTIRPGWTKRKIRWGEAIRGWRTILIRGVELRLWTPWQVETEFSVAQNPEWHRYMGKGTIIQ